MGTKRNPGAFDCYANAAADEPMFVLLARDESAPRLIREWVRYREVSKGRPWPVVVDPSLPQFDDKAREALACADAMETWKPSATAALSVSQAPEQLMFPRALRQRLIAQIDHCFEETKREGIGDYAMHLPALGKFLKDVRASLSGVSQAPPQAWQGKDEK